MLLPRETSLHLDLKKKKKEQAEHQNEYSLRSNLNTHNTPMNKGRGRRRWRLDQPCASYHTLQLTQAALVARH